MNDCENIWLHGENEPFPTPVVGDETICRVSAPDDIRAAVIEELKYQLTELELGNTEIFNANIVKLCAGSNDPEVSIVRMNHLGGSITNIEERFETSDAALDLCEKLTLDGLFDAQLFNDSTTYTVGSPEMEHSIYTKLYSTEINKDQ